MYFPQLVDKIHFFAAVVRSLSTYQNLHFGKKFTSYTAQKNYRPTNCNKNFFSRFTKSRYSCVLSLWWALTLLCSANNNLKHFQALQPHAIIVAHYEFCVLFSANILNKLTGQLRKNSQVTFFFQVCSCTLPTRLCEQH